ncbi:HIV Tat-specific factor 1 homolog [Arvicola amphibius]|uniref:HIV Tat-specific factor 1 homolog n=1 Tax=Arvicola amphibius TaxID=1047088 RepID=UPI0018E330FB|nr:HIV Tat-specific factor 1 homolog [Arvicola amphibius]
MSGNNLSGNDEFDEQLRMQELYGDPKDGDTQNDPSGETDSLGQPPDDTPYVWDLDKKAWFPKITEDFIAKYQANYGFSSDGVSSSTVNVQDTNMKTVEEPQTEIPEVTDSKERGEKRKADSGWFHVEEDRNTNVYVSGLPPDITVDEFIQLMSKFGIIMRDPQTEEFKVKLYKDNQGNLKGDGLCCYLKKESVELALKLLDEDEIRGYKLHVEVARFQLKGEYDASKKKKKCKDYKKKLSLQQKQLDWRPERRAGPCRMRHEQVVIIKNMFHPTDFEDDPLVLNEIREDLRVECSKFGQIRKLLLFDRHPDGVASVSFREPEEADYCIQTLDGRWFGGRQITAQAWDGTTDYQVEETSREREERVRGWEAFLNGPEANRGLQCMDSICASEKAGPSRGRHFSEHQSRSNTGAQEAITGMAFGETIDENKFEKAEDGGKTEGNAFEKDAKEGGSDEDDPDRECEEGCAKRESEEALPESELEEGNPKMESQEHGPERESKKKGKDNYEKYGLAKGSEDSDHSRESEGADSLKKESEDHDSASEEDCLEKQSVDGVDEDLEENGVQHAFDQDASDKESPKNIENGSVFSIDSDTSEFEEGSEGEFDEDLDEKEEEDEEGAVVYEMVFEDESDENNGYLEADEEYGDADDKEEEDDADEKLFDDSEKEEEEDTDVKKDEDTSDKLFEDASSEKFFEEEEGLNELFDDSDERWSVGNMEEDGSQSTDGSFVLSSDEAEM